MRIDGVAFGITDRSAIAPTTHRGDSGQARWRTRQFGALRVQMVEQTDGAEPRCSSTKVGASLFIVD